LFVELNSQPPASENTATMEELCTLHADRRDTYSKPSKQPNSNKLTLLDKDVCIKSKQNKNKKQKTKQDLTPIISNKATQCESHNCIIIGNFLHSFPSLADYFISQLMSPEGEILCKCDLKKINWYLDRNLGEIVAQDPITLKFNVSTIRVKSEDAENHIANYLTTFQFAPKGMGHAGDPYCIK
jgi:hypothetical protein